MIGRVSGESGLQFGQVAGNFLQLAGTLQVLEQNIGAIGSLLAQEVIVDGLQRADHQVHLAVRHIQPGKFALIIIIGENGIGLLEKVVADAGLDGDVGGSLEIVGNLLHVGGVGVVVPDGFQRAVGGALHQRVGAVLEGVVPGFEFLYGHILRVETGAGRSGAEAIQEGLLVNAVPGAVVHVGEFTLGIGKGAEESLVPESLLPIDGIGLVCCKAVQVENLFSIVGDPREIRCGNDHLCIVLQQALGLGAAFLAGPEPCGSHGENQCDSELFHCY